MQLVSANINTNVIEAVICCGDMVKVSRKYLTDYSKIIPTYIRELCNFAY